MLLSVVVQRERTMRSKSDGRRNAAIASKKAVFIFRSVRCVVVAEGMAARCRSVGDKSTG